MSDFETPDIAKQRAKARAEQACAEQAGVYVKSYTRTVNSTVEDDEIIAIANTIIKIVDEEYIVTPVSDSGGSFRIVAKIRATVDSARIDAWLARDWQKNRDLVAQNKKLQEDKAKQDAELADLRKKLTEAKSVQEKKEIEAGVVTADRKFLSNQKVEEGWRLFDTEDFVGAVAVFSQAIGLDEENARAFSGRGASYFAQADTTHAIADCNKAIELDTNYSSAYAIRSFIYCSQGNFKQSIWDSNKIIEIDPKQAGGYAVCGYIYFMQRNYQQAIVDINKSIELNPKLAAAYWIRGHRTPF